MDRKIDPPPSLDHLTEPAKAFCLLPDPATVAVLGRALFPTIRASRANRRFGTTTVNGTTVMFDDNTTPRWALLWSHGHPMTSQPRGWTVAHVWPNTQDPHAYTHPANLLLVAEPLAGLTDKDAPLARHLRYHASHVYGWRPHDTPEPCRPEDHNEDGWRYLDGIKAPDDHIQQRIAALDNERLRIMRRLTPRDRSEP